MLSTILVWMLYTTPITPTVPIVYEQLGNIYTVSYINPGQILVMTVYTTGGVTGQFFDTGENVSIVFVEADTIEQIFFNIVVDKKLWKIQPKIIPLSKNHLPLIQK